MEKTTKLLLLMLLVSLGTLAAQNDMDKHLPANWGGWKNLSCSVNDTTYYTGSLLSMQATVSGKTLHVFWPDKQRNAQGEACIYYRRSTDAGKTWEDARAVVKTKKIPITDGNYYVSSIGGNSKWYAVEGQNIHLVNILRSDDGNNDELLYTYSHDGGKTFQQRILAEGSEGDGHYYYGRPHVVTDGQTVVIAFQRSRYNYNNYRTRVLTSFDGGASFVDKEIDTKQELADVQVSGRRWTVLGSASEWYNYVSWANVYMSTSTDGGETISIQNIAPIIKDDKSWCELNFSYGSNGGSCNYHPQMTLEGDVINVIFKGCIDKDEEHPEYNGSRAHTIFRRSTDGGKTWTDAMYLPGTTGTSGSIVAKGQHIYVLQSPHGPKIWYSHDGGKTWNTQERCYWTGRYDDYGNFYELYIAPDDNTGQHVYMTGVRALLVESKDGFRTVHRNFDIGTESWDYKNWNNQSLTVLMDSEGTEHWLMNYSSQYKPFDSYFWNIVYRRNDPEPATTNKNMALDISKVVGQKIDRPLTNVVIPMTPSIMETAEATTVECWIRVDQGCRMQIASLSNDGAINSGSIFYGGWYIDVGSDGNDWFTFQGGVSTDLSVDGKGKNIWDRWRYQITDWGLWHHVALTYDSKVEKDNVRLYADGLLIGTATESGKLRIGNNPIVIGRGDNSYGPKALVDNFAIYSRALTQEEIMQHIQGMPDAKDKDCRLLLTFDGSLQDQSQYHNDPAPLMDANLVEHDGIRLPHPEFTLTKDIHGQVVYGNDMTQDGEAYWWIMPYPNNPDSYETSRKAHVTKNFADHPGNYAFTMIAKGTGDCNAFASVTKNITIEGLSRVYPTVAGQYPGTKLNIEGGYTLTYYNQPRVVLKQGDTEIVGKWDVEYGYDGSKITSLAEMAPASFNLWKAPLGKYDVIVGNDTLRQAFTVEQHEEPDVWMQVNGREKILWDKYLRLTIDYGNRANVAAYNTPMFIIIPDRHGTVDVQFDFNFDLCSYALDEPYQQMAQQLGDHLKAYDPATGDSVRVYSFLIPYIGPNSTNQCSFRVKGKNGADIPTNEMNICYWIEEPWGPLGDDEVVTRGDELDDLIDDNGKVKANLRGKGNVECAMEMLGRGFLEYGITAIPGVGCAWNAFKTVSLGIWGEDRSWSAFGTNFVSAAFACGSDLFPPSLLVKAGVFFASAAWDFVSNADAYKSCRNGDPHWRRNTFVGSLDPNEMIGPWGPDDNRHYIKPIHQMAYTVTFENKSSATAPAHEVFVNDTLDAEKYDLSTFTFTSFGWADTTLVVGGSKTKEFTRDVKYTVNGQDILVRVSGQFDELKGIASWSFVSLKKNGDEIEDPDLGFLLPNNDNHDGEGFVSFSVEHKANPASGSTVSNKATIVFDANAPITTNTYVNTFDTDYPESRITDVKEKNGQLVVTVDGADATSGIGTYNIYVFKNDGEAELAAKITDGNKASFACEEGVRYGLCVLATDRVGWNEPKDLKAETEFITSGEAAPHTTSVVVAATGYATFYDSQYSYTLPAGLKASIVSSYADDRLTYETLSESTVPKGVAVLLEADKKEAATYTLTSTNTTYSSAIGTNLLHGSDVATTTKADAGSLFYKLAFGPSNTSLAHAFGWFWGAQNGEAFRIDGHRAWLALPKQAAARAYLLDMESTGINDASFIVNSGEEGSDDKWFDMQGRRIEKPRTPGFYFRGNQKVVIK